MEELNNLNEGDREEPTTRDRGPRYKGIIKPRSEESQRQARNRRFEIASTLEEIIKLFLKIYKSARNHEPPNCNVNNSWGCHVSQD